MQPRFNVWFEIDGEVKVLGPGQACIALVDQTHTVRNVGDEPVISLDAVKIGR